MLTLAGAGEGSGREAIDARDSGIRPARCWPALGRDGQDGRPRGETLLSSSLTPTNAKRRVPAASAISPFAESPPRIRMGAIRAKNNHVPGAKRPPLGGGSATCHAKPWMVWHGNRPSPSPASGGGKGPKAVRVLADRSEAEPVSTRPGEAGRRQHAFQNSVTRGRCPRTPGIVAKGDGSDSMSTRYSLGRR